MEVHTDEEFSKSEVSEILRRHSVLRQVNLKVSAETQTEEVKREMAEIGTQTDTDTDGPEQLQNALMEQKRKL